MDYLIILLSGLIQGITEFLPISSSGHLLILGNIFNLKNNFEIAVLLNIGTLGALVYCSRQTLFDIGRQISSHDWQLFLKLLVSLLPAGLLGFFLTDFFKGLAEEVWLIAIMLFFVGCLMLFKPPAVKIQDLKDIKWSQALIIASAQALALIPGTSRAGITILVALWLGFKKEVAINWSFLLAIPIMTGALLRILMTTEGARFVIEHPLLVLVGNVVAFIIGLFALQFLISLVRKYSLKPFGFYRIGLAVVLLSLVMWKGF